MNLFKDPRTNWKYILVVIIFGIIVNFLILSAEKSSFYTLTSSPPPSFSVPRARKDNGGEDQTFIKRQYEVGKPTCNVYPAMGCMYFYQRCECDGKLVEEPVPEWVDPVSFHEDCLGEIKRVYYVFDTNWPAVMQEVGEKEITNLQEALNICTDATNVLKEVYKYFPEYARDFEEHCRNSANYLFPQ